MLQHVTEYYKLFKVSFLFEVHEFNVALFNAIMKIKFLINKINTNVAYYFIVLFCLFYSKYTN